MGSRPRRNLILLPGGCDTAWIFGDIAPRLATGARVTSLTPRGCGFSGRPERGYGIANHVADVAAFMDKLGVPKAVLAGHSWGRAGGAVGLFGYRVWLCGSGVGGEDRSWDRGAIVERPDGIDGEVAGVGAIVGFWGLVGGAGSDKAPSNSRKELRADLKAGAYARTRVSHLH